jgi:hypothetical protein
VLAQQRLSEIRENTVHSIQRHSRRRRDFDADRLPAVPVIDPEQTVSDGTVLALFSPV